jgi:hypothetical protein
MPFALIGGQEVRFATFTEETEEYSGEEAQSFANTPLSSRTNAKRRWGGQTIPYLPSDMATVRALVGNGTVSLTCSGTAFEDATLTCRITITGAPYVRDRGAPDGFKKEYAFRFREV